MAPGCTLINDHSQQIISSTSSSTHLSSDSSDKARSMHCLTNSISYTHSGLVSCYDPFYLDQIPLPSTPPPPQAQSTIKSNKMVRSIKSPSYRSLDTVDSFEILEQTIMKQKRLGRIKNTDLRKKILLKRTFNLVCEMMDQENGYDGSNNSKDEKEDTTSSVTLTQEQKDDCDLQETLIINLNESESLDSAFQDDFEAAVELNYTDLENFNYANLLENEQPMGATSQASEDDSCLEKNKSFLCDDFFSGSEQFSGNQRPNKRRRSSADDDIDFDEDEQEEDYLKTTRTSETNFYMFSDLTNSNGESGKKKRCLDNSINSKSQDSNGGVASGNMFKESINIVT